MNITPIGVQQSKVLAFKSNQPQVVYVPVPMEKSSQNSHRGSFIGGLGRFMVSMAAGIATERTVIKKFPNTFNKMGGLTQLASQFVLFFTGSYAADTVMDKIFGRR